MVLTTHALVGAVIGKNISNPFIVAGVSLAVHFLLDTLRHGEYITLKSKLGEAWKTVLDLSIGVALILIVSFFSPPSGAETRTMIIGVIFSILPDSLTFFYWKLHCTFLQPIIDFHAWVHKYPRFSPQRDWNLGNEKNDILVSAIAIAILILF
jgi:hypothetical protein